MSRKSGDNQSKRRSGPGSGSISGPRYGRGSGPGHGSRSGAGGGRDRGRGRDRDQDMDRGMIWERTPPVENVRVVEAEPIREVQPKEKKGKKSNFVNLYTNDGKDKEAVMLPGRHPCLCEATAHNLVANCLNCGRIVCNQEGSGPCFTCQEFVGTREERAAVNSNTEQGRSLYIKLMGKPPVIYKPKAVNLKAPEGPLNSARAPPPGLQDSKQQNFKEIAAALESAISQKDRLLEFDRNVEKRTRVIDDERDYFKIQSEHWMDDETREEVQAQAQHLHENKRSTQRKFDLDFTGKKVVERKVRDIDDQQVEAIIDDLQQKAAFKSDYEIVNTKDINRNVVLPKPVYCLQPKEKENPVKGGLKPGEKLNKVNKPKEERDFLKNMTRLQDANQMEMSDEGICLTLQQPWASLLLEAVKLHEGRAWFTPYRGRLWIHSGSKNPSQEEIRRVEENLRFSYEGPFPRAYPSGCLLGCVSLVDCLPQEEYRSQHPSGIVDDPYVFICDEPKLLVVKIPMQGNSKLYKLDPKIHGAAF